MNTLQTDILDQAVGYANCACLQPRVVNFRLCQNLKLRTVINFFSNEVNLQLGKSATRYPFKNRDLTHIPFGFLFFRFEYLKFSHEHVTDTRIRSPRVTFFVELLRNFTNHFKSECG